MSDDTEELVVEVAAYIITTVLTTGAWMMYILDGLGVGYFFLIICALAFLSYGTAVGSEGYNRVLWGYVEDVVKE